MVQNICHQHFYQYTQKKKTEQGRNEKDNRTYELRRQNVIQPFIDHCNLPLKPQQPSFHFLPRNY